ncbi:MAG: hypothetical protein ACLQU2_00175 [Candidatus Binataceae bacterium]
MNALVWAVLTVGFMGSAYATCQLNSPSGKIKHVVYIEFDNQHFTRDNPNVPSDLEQQPNLLNFIEQNGTLDAGDHTVLISHTANDILTTQTGLYSDDDGIFIANSFLVFGPGSGLASIYFPSSFFYWTDLVSDITAASADHTFALTTPAGDNVPAPWVPFTRAGCDVGAFSTANIVLERAPFDVDKVFGASSPQAMESTSQQTADFIGEAIHCAQGSSLCTAVNGAVSDLLPDEPGGYSGYQALFGAKYISPALGGLKDLNGGSLSAFPGFDPVPAQTLGAVAQMLEKGIPVVFAYIADAHDNQEGSSLSSEQTFGPGEAPYVKQLADYNTAWGQFFTRLQKDGIDQTNTLFVITPDEGDHFVGGEPSPANCDGVKIVHGSVVPDVACTYGTNGVGELDLNLNGATAAAGDSTPFAIHFDDAATVFVPGQPEPGDPSVRQLEQTMAGLSAVNPHTGLSESLLGTGLGPELQGALVDPITQKLLHMNTVADLAREPTFTFFGNPNFFFESSGSTTPIVGTGFAWNHGDIQPEIGRTFIGIVGPGVRHLGVTQLHDFFTDHVDVRPTIMSLVGLTDSYQHDGRVILELLDRKILPSSLHAHSATLLKLGQIYKQLDAPFGELAQSALTVSTYAIASTSTNDRTYANLESQIASWTTQRDGLAAQIKSMLEGAEFNGRSIDEQQARQIIRQGQALLNQARDCASDPANCGG